jgi:ArsR family transcriptional regulator
MSKQKTKEISTRLANLLRSLSHPVRLEILLVIGNQEACVCHLEATLRQRQAYLSQHLMEMRDAGIITSRRDGRFIYYRMADEKLPALLSAAANYLGIDPQTIESATNGQPQTGCSCPKCSAAPDRLIIPDELLQAQYVPPTKAENA